MMRAALILLAVLWMSLAPAFAVTPEEMLSDPKLEARAREISKELRCLVCQNQSIDDSNADLAHDLRVLVRTRLKAGDSDAQVVKYIVNRYGQFVLLRPPVEPETYLLWFGPLAIVLLGIAGTFFYLRRRTQIPEAAALSAEEEKRLAKLVGPEDKP